ncbi:hypothetical protein ERO13_D03G125050v2 [Gossypium hirsutum]|nr:hypothetical protein ERO13_D03G125050v2 [Gossypium hirsutum]
MVDGKSRDMSTKELFGGARIHYLFQRLAAFLQEVDPRAKLTDEDIVYALRNSSGLRNVPFVPEVSMTVIGLVRRQIAQLSDPCHQCLWIVYDELVKARIACESTGLKRFPSLRRHINDVVRNFLDAGAKPAETMIRNVIEMKMDYINSSHPSFTGGNKAVELAVKQMRHQRADAEKVPISDKGQFSRTGNHLQSNNGLPVLTGGSLSTRSWGISSIFWSKASPRGTAATESPEETLHDAENMSSTIQPREPPSILRPLEMSENEATEIIITRILVKSYFDKVRKNIQDLVSKAIMHFLVNHTKGNLHNTFIQILYQEILFEELLQEQDEVVARRKHAKEVLRVLRQAVKTLNEVPTQDYKLGY